MLQASGSRDAGGTTRAKANQDGGGGGYAGKGGGGGEGGEEDEWDGWALGMGC